MNESVKRLEEKIAYLERHVTEQDKAMLELSDGLDRLRKEVLKLRDQGSRGGMAGTADSGESPEQDRPPHY